MRAVAKEFVREEYGHVEKLKQWIEAVKAVPRAAAARKARSV